MASDQSTQTSNKNILFVTLASVPVIVFLVLLYSSVKEDAYAKTQLYSVEVQLDSGDSSRMVVYYDYGYGFQLGHHQIFDLASQQRQTLNFTISAWKALSAIRIDSDDSFDLNSVLINKNNIDYQALESSVQVTKENFIVLDNINLQPFDVIQ